MARTGRRTPRAGANAGEFTQRVYVEGRSGLERTIGVSINGLVAELAGLVKTITEAAVEVSFGAAEISVGNASLARRAARRLAAGIASERGA